MKNIFIIGSKGIPGAYGGYETFVDKLTEYHQYNKKIKYHVACKSKDSNETVYHNARCFNVKVPNIGPAQAIYYDVMALNECCKYIKKNQISDAIIYILACRIGPFMPYFQKKVHKLGGRIYVNPDGHEWLRAKWSKPVRIYWKESERIMIKYSDLVICDSKNIERYIQNNYKKYQPSTTYIAYGTETRKSKLADDDERLLSWYADKGLMSKQYYLVVGRFVPENNYEIMIKEFIESNTKKDFVLITNVNTKFLQELASKTNFNKDSRIKFVGTVYDQELLMKIRENAYGYLHGHEVGGTNPSLLESLGATDINLLLDVGFNKECAEEGALYWSKDEKNLSNLIDKADRLSQEEIIEISSIAHKRMHKWYSWSFIASEYEKVFLENK